MAGNVSWVDYAQIGLLIIGVCLWFFPKKSRGGATLRLPLWNSSWWEGGLYLTLGVLVVVTGLPGGFLLPCIVFLLLREIGNSRHSLSLTNKCLSWTEITQTSVRSFILHWPILFLVYWLWTKFLPDAKPQGNVQALREGGLAMQLNMAILAVIIAPLTEEFFFRGILYRTLKSLIDSGPAILLTSLAFALAHQNLLAFGPLFALSIFLIISYEKSGHLAVPILYHAFFNLLMVTFIVFGNAGT